MKNINFKQLRRRRAIGLALMILGVIVLVMPLFIGQWMISLLGIAFVAAGVLYFIDTMRTADETTGWLSYLTGVGFVILGGILFISPSVALSGTLIAITLYLLIDGGLKVYGAVKLTGADRWWALFNGLFSLGGALLIWSFVSVNLGGLAIGIVLGLKLLVEGWTMFFGPQKEDGALDEKPDPREHPDVKLHLAPSNTIKQINETIDNADTILSGQNVIWCLTLLLIMFFIHFIRTASTFTFIGLITPVTATIGDAAVAFILGVAVILPIRLLWRKFTRPVERTAWKRFHSLEEKKQDLTLVERGMKFWMEGRMGFAKDLRTMRESLNFAFWNLLKFGLPFVALFVAINSIWGFSWYFNSENWASGVFQRMATTRVDPWRQASATETEKAAIANGVPPEKVFALEPAGITNGDFSFIVIGDTGEGDTSQMILRDQIIAASNREDVKFLVVSSDVIYPDGKMNDYEFNFYLPFKGFTKPIYAIPGNHDWYDADQGFNVNFLDPVSADISLRAQVAADLNTDVTASAEKFNNMIAEAKRLREYYRVDNGHQRAPYFEIHTPGFSFITLDTGVTKTIDDKEKAWLEDALNRAGENFKFVVLGHPFYVAGGDGTEDHPEFAAILETLKRHKVQIAMAGDTHDFEHYKMKYPADDGEREMLHFVNGGGGAYLSIGTSVGYPVETSVSPDYAFYPRKDEVEAKIKTESPLWKLPFLIWLQRFQGWPFGPEMVSGAFDFNRAPFFQSFVEVKVERSQNRVRLLLWGVNGQLRWRDIHTVGNIKPPDKTDDDFVEFIAPLTQQMPTSP